MARQSRYALIFLAILLCANAATASPKTAFSGLVADDSLIRSLEKAEELYSSGNYERAYFIYRNELAPIGDKYAQYMVGYLHLTGQGTHTDRVAATAWYRLAAERGTKEFVVVHNQLLVSLTAEQIEEYERLFLDLRKRYGDLPLLMRGVRKNIEQLRERTGSRTGGGASPVTVIDMRRGITGSAEEYYEVVEKRLNVQFEMIAQYTGMENTSFDLDTIDLDMIQLRVNEALERLD